MKRKTIFFNFSQVVAVILCLDGNVVISIHLEPGCSQASVLCVRFCLFFMPSSRLFFFCRPSVLSLFFQSGLLFTWACQPSPRSCDGLHTERTICCQRKAEVSVCVRACDMCVCLCLVRSFFQRSWAFWPHNIKATTGQIQ